MELHLHLSVAFRALDRKWGTPVDLEDSSETSYSLPCLPAVIDRPTTTFSSEEFLRRQYRLSHCEDVRRKENVKKHDSFSNISCTGISCLNRVESKDSGLGDDTLSEENLVEQNDSETSWGSTASLDSGLKEKRIRSENFAEMKARPHYEDRRRRENVKRHDSFSNISWTRMPYLNLVKYKDSESGDDTLSEEMLQNDGEPDWSSTASLDSSLEKKRSRSKIFAQMKTCVKWLKKLKRS